MLRENAEEFAAKVEALSLKYKQVKKRVFLAEHLSGQVVLDTINELRNSYDHVMRASYAATWEESCKELERAEGHLYRAAYDAYQIIHIFAYDEIQKLLSQYSSEVIVQVIPEYYTDLKPKINELHEDMVKCRSMKLEVKERPEDLDKSDEFDSLIKDKFDEYDETASAWKAIRDRVQKCVPDLEQVAQEKRKSKLRSELLSPFVIGLLTGLGILAITLLVS